MTKLLLIRHGQSTANLGHFFAGHIDSPLTELGMDQARLTAQYIAAHYKVDAVYSSDLKRAASVGEVVAACTGQKITLQQNLREIHAGDWEGKTFDVLEKEFPAYQIWLKDTGRAVCDGGESVAQLQKRFLAAVTEIAENHKDQTVAIATHATPIRVLQCWCEGRPIADLKHVPWVSNASVTEVDYDNGNFNIVRVGYDGHLGDAISKFPANV